MRYKKKILGIIMAIAMCMTCMAMPCKAKAAEYASNLYVSSLEIQTGHMNGIEPETYYLKGVVASNAGMDYMEMALYREQDNYNLYRREIINLYDTRTVNFEDGWWPVVDTLSENAWGNYRVELKIVDNAGHSATRTLYYTVEKSLGSYLAGLYKYVLLRDPELSGYISNMQSVTYRGVSIDTMVRSFYGSLEYNSKPMPSNEEFVLSLYRAILGREPDPEGFQNHVNGLYNGASRDALINVFLYSAEYNYTVVWDFDIAQYR